MNLNMIHGVYFDQSACALILAVYLQDGSVKLSEEAKEFDSKSGNLLSGLIEAGEITGRLNETTVLYPSGLKVGKVIVVGLGVINEYSMEKVRQTTGTAVKVAAKGRTEKIITTIHCFQEANLCPRKVMQATAEGAVLALTNSDFLKSKPKAISLQSIEIVLSDPELPAKLHPYFEKGLAMAKGTVLARRLTTLPANYLTPSHLEEEARKVVNATGIKLEVLERSDMQRLGMGCLLGVSQGSAQPPKMIILRHDGDPESKEILALVGKGITFDAGGISLKQAAGMEAMKGDMGGAAAVLGAMQIVGELKPKANIIGVIAASENLPDGNAFKPGDVLKGMTGKTIEIISTDAEGRLILADAVAYAEKLGACRIIDVATLTGASAQAFGGVYATILADCDQFYADTMSAAEMSGERFWRMPLADEYREMYKSPVADIKNGGARGGGMITGGLIIREFIDQAAWVHLDIAGMSSNQDDRPYMPKGYNGFATRTLAELALSCDKDLFM